MSTLHDLSQRLKAAVGMVGAAHHIIEGGGDTSINDARWTLEEGVKALRQIDEELELAAPKFEPTAPRRPAPADEPVAAAAAPVPPALRGTFETVYSAIAVCVATLDCQAADRDIDAARVLRTAALNPLSELLFGDESTEGGAS